LLAVDEDGIHEGFLVFFLCVGSFCKNHGLILSVPFRKKK
jgi:hypothetical protein